MGPWGGRETREGAVGQSRVNMLEGRALMVTSKARAVSECSTPGPRGVELGSSEKEGLRFKWRPLSSGLLGQLVDGFIY